MKDFQLCCIWWRPWWQARTCLPNMPTDCTTAPWSWWFGRPGKNGHLISKILTKWCTFVILLCDTWCLLSLLQRVVFFCFVLYVLNCFWTVWTLLVCDLCSARLPKDIEQENIQAECCRTSCATIWNFRCSQHVSYMRSWHGNVMNYVYCCICLSTAGCWLFFGRKASSLSSEMFLFIVSSRHWTGILHDHIAHSPPMLRLGVSHDRIRVKIINIMSPNILQQNFLVTQRVSWLECMAVHGSPK